MNGCRSATSAWHRPDDHSDLRRGVPQPQQRLYGALALYITTKVLDLVVYGQNTAKVAYIISDKYEEIMQEMLRRDMGVTLLNGKGGYTGAERPLLFCAIRKKEAVSIKRYIKELDPDAFFIVCDASEVLGEGFGEYDPQGL
ncbi:MAG: YitT family protein [Oscillospiraceae bacterium]